MRTCKSFIIALAIAMVIPLSLSAQDAPKNQAYHIHEDVVKPSMVGEYEAICKEFLGHMKSYNIQGAKWIAASTADSRYLYVQPIDNMADLDKNPISQLAEKMGKEQVGDLFDRMDKCYDTEQDYVVVLNEELSYMPDGISQTVEGENYRKWHYLYVSPENRGIVKKKMKAVHDLFTSKNSAVHYRVYKSGFGTRGEFYLVSVAAKDPVDYAQRAAENDVLLGEDGKLVFQELFGSLLRYEEVVGYMRPDMAYTPDAAN